MKRSLLPEWWRTVILPPETVRAFGIALLANIVAFGSFLFYPVLTTDDFAVLAHGLRHPPLWRSPRPLADGLVATFFGSAAAPTLQLLIVLVAGSAAAVAVARAWGLRRTSSLALVATLMTTMPPFADQYAFLTNTLRLMPLSFPLAMWAFLIARRTPRRLAASAACLLAAFLLYQLAINLFAMLIVAEVTLLLVFVGNRDAMQERRERVTSALGVGALTTIVGIGVMKLLVAGDSRLESSLTPISTLPDLGEKLAMYARALDYSGREVFLGARHGTVAVMIALLILGISLFLHFRRRFGPLSSGARTAVTTACLAAMFVCTLATQALNTYSLLFWRVLVGAGVMYGFLWTLIVRLTPRRSIGRLAGLVLGWIVALLFISADNFYHLAFRLKNAEEYAVVNRIAARVEALNPADGAVSLVVLGTLNSGLVPVDSHVHCELHASVLSAPWSRDSVWQYVGVRVRSASADQVQRACQLSRSIGIWPAASSVHLEDGLVVVKLADGDPRCEP